METLGFAPPGSISAFLPSSSTCADDNAMRMTSAPTVDVAAMIELAADVRMVEDFKGADRRFILESIFHELPCSRFPLLHMLNIIYVPCAQECSNPIRTCNYPQRKSKFLSRGK